MTALQFGTTAPSARVSSSTGQFETQRAHLRLTRRGRLVLAAVVSLPLIAGLAAFAVLGGTSAIATGDSSAVTYSYVTVQPGESLWAIAQQLDPKADPRD
ncbi:MAG: LysM peptidoglycan-binding protein, partial [Subtercola sp.]|nr:LysM peptidoglycan-binding protein [Subtercola sp.]